MKPLAIITLLLTLLCSCGDDRTRIDQGYDLMGTGNFDGAFESFQRAALARPDDPEIKGAMGILLSLRSISVPAAIQLLEESLRETKDAERKRKTRWHLLTLYLDLGRTENARDILSAERVPLEEFFSPEMSLYRAGVECVSDPGKRRLKVLEKSSETLAARYFLVRCFLSPDWRKKEQAEKRKLAAEILEKIETPDEDCQPDAGEDGEDGQNAKENSGAQPAPEKITPEECRQEKRKSREYACELLATWPLIHRPELENYDDRLRACRKSFPGSIPVQRELSRGPTPAPKEDEDKDAADEQMPLSRPGLRKIFSDAHELSPYPDIPHWKSVTGGINLETGKEYVRITQPDPNSSISPDEDDEDPDTRDYDEYFRDARP